jgi:hypothetical protein
MGHCNAQTTINKVNERTSAKSNLETNLRNKLEFEIYEANSTKQKNDRYPIELLEIVLKNE